MTEGTEYLSSSISYLLDVGINSFENVAWLGRRRKKPVKQLHQPLSWNRLSMPINKMLNHSYQTSFSLILKCSYGVSSCSLCSTDLWWEDVFLFWESLPTRLDELRTFVKCFRLCRWGRRGFSALLMWRQIRVWLTQQSEKPTLSLCSHSCKWKELKGFSRNRIFLKPGTQSSCATAL